MFTRICVGALVLVVTIESGRAETAGQIAFIRVDLIEDRQNRDVFGLADIFSMNTDGSGVLNLSNEPPFTDAIPAWSPDGSRIAFASDRDGQFDLYRMNADGSDVTRLTDDPAFDREPTWSPDGSRIAFMSDRGGLDGAVPDGRRRDCHSPVGRDPSGSLPQLVS